MKVLQRTVDGIGDDGLPAPAVLVENRLGEVSLVTRQRLAHTRECQVCGSFCDAGDCCRTCAGAMAAECARQAMLDGDGALCSPI